MHPVGVDNVPYAPKLIIALKCDSPIIIIITRVIIKRRIIT